MVLQGAMLALGCLAAIEPAFEVFSEHFEAPGISSTGTGKPPLKELELQTSLKGAQLPRQYMLDWQPHVCMNKPPKAAILSTEPCVVSITNFNETLTRRISNVLDRNRAAEAMRPVMYVGGDELSVALRTVSYTLADLLDLPRENARIFVMLRDEVQAHLKDAQPEIHHDSQGPEHDILGTDASIYGASHACTATTTNEYLLPCFDINS